MAFQIIWLSRVYSFEQKTFNHDVVTSIREVYDELGIRVEGHEQLNKLIELPEPHSFLFRIDTVPDMEKVYAIVERELEERNIFTSCEISVYSRTARKYIQQMLTEPAAHNYATKPKFKAPKFERDYNYISLYFPNRNRFILSAMQFWTITTSILFVVIIILASCLFYLYRQKFLNELQKDFVNNISHEFKTPLAVMKIAAEVLAGDQILDQPEKLAKYSRIIQEQTDHLQDHVEKLLKLSYDGKQLLKPRLAPGVVNDLIRKTLHSLSPLIEQKKAVITLDLEAENRAVMVNAEAMQMVVANLVENALKYAQEPQITLRTGLQGSYYYLSCSDNGPGIDKKHRKKIFDRFYRVPTGNVHNVKGFGLGLSFVKIIVSKHGGRVTVDSEPGKGSTFTILLPLPKH